MNQEESINFAKKYLETIICNRAGDKMNNIVDHINDAVYDPASCQWALPNDDGTTPSFTPAKAAQAPTSTPDKS